MIAGWTGLVEFALYRYPSSLVWDKYVLLLTAANFYGLQGRWLDIIPSLFKTIGSLAIWADRRGYELIIDVLEQIRLRLGATEGCHEYVILQNRLPRIR